MLRSIYCYISIQIKDSLYCFLIPTNHGDTILMTKMWKKAVIPEAKIRVARLQSEILGGGTMDEMLTPPELTPPDIAAAIVTEEMIKAAKEASELILTMDGCWAQVKSTFDDINDAFNKEGYQGYSINNGPAAERCWKDEL